MAISEPCVLINGKLQSLHSFQQKFGSNCPLCDFVNAVFPTLIKQTILPIIRKVMPIILNNFQIDSLRFEFRTILEIEGVV